MNLFFLTFFLLSVSAFILIPLIVFFYRKAHKDAERRLTPHLMWCVMTAISSFFCFVPYFWLGNETSPVIARAGKTLLSSLHGIIRVFSVDDGFTDILAEVSEYGVASFIYQCYSFVCVAVFFIAPVLTLGFVLSLFKNLHAYYQYYTFYGKNVHVFSELNERSLALARSIMEKANEKTGKISLLKKKSLVIFADILDKNEEEHLDLVAAAKEIGAILFRQDISAIRFKRYAHKMVFYLLSEDETEKISHMEDIIERYKDIAGTKLYVFSDTEESKCFLDSYPNKEALKLEVIRVNDIRSLIYHNLDLNGIRLFEGSHKVEDERVIQAAVIGFGKYGKELTKALLWYTQLPGYRLDLTVFDENAEAEGLFSGMCPNFVLNVPRGNKDDMRYKIHFECCRAGTKEFYDKLEELKNISYVFVCLGEDNLNIASAMEIRNRLARERRYPDIETVVHNSKIKERIGVKWDTEISETKEEKDNDYQDLHKIHIIGDLESFYSEDAILTSDLVKDGLSIHYRYSSIVEGVSAVSLTEEAKRTFYMNDYGFFSSVAKALHARLRSKIAERLEAEEKEPKEPKDGKPTAKELFFAFVPETEANDPDRKDAPYFCNRFVLENTVDTETAWDFSKEMLALEALHALKPYTVKACELEEVKGCTLNFDGEKFTIGGTMEIAKSAARMEHIRWTAYMYTEGFSQIDRDSFVKKKDQPLKMHFNLTPCDDLTFYECIKDI